MARAMQTRSVFGSWGKAAAALRPAAVVPPAVGASAPAVQDFDGLLAAHALRANATGIAVPHHLWLGADAVAVVASCLRGPRCGQ